MAICCECGKRFNKIRRKEELNEWLLGNDLDEETGDDYIWYCVDCAINAIESDMDAGRRFLEECAPYRGYDED